MQPEIVILNMSRNYQQEKFYQHQRFHWVDCTDLHGVNCYCTAEAEQILRQRIAPFGPQGIHFLDSGNYHYISQFWLEKIREPFHLVLFDYHSDMQPPIFPELLSCGCWVKNVLDTNSFLQNVWMIGPDETAFAGVAEEYRKRLVFISLQQLSYESTIQRLLAMPKDDVPFYISLDKDVLSRHFARTNWSQGELSLPVLEHLMGSMLQSRRVIGVDICGECANGLQMLYQSEDEVINDTANKELLQFLLQQAKQKK